MGVFVDGNTENGASDLAGNISAWTSSNWGKGVDEPTFKYPYDAADGREDAAAPPDTRRVVRGGSWDLPSNFARAAFRFWLIPDFRNNYVGVRLAVSAPISVKH
ncbi:MAG: hypothetical protein DYG90_09350 [Chloroflexi bacterium CFX6]|nr:hypothetical protein [Chloroflexi bacterium CFX6]